MKRDKLLGRAKNAMRESKTVDFKREFDVTSAAAWCEIIKDIVAFANSGGGVIVLGVEDNGKSVEVDLSSVLAHDTADITNKILRYTNSQFSDFDFVEIERTGNPHVAIVIEEADVPIVFTKPGTYDVGGGKQKTAFSQGTVYFRHGSKSEPANREDFMNWRDRAIAKARKTWLGGIKKVVQAPPGEAVAVLSSAETPKTNAAVVHAKIASDSSGIPVMPANAAEIWPYRQVDLVRQINQQLGEAAIINAYDIQCINKMLSVLKSRPEFANKFHEHAAPQYSQKYADWIIEQFNKDKDFFKKTRAQRRPQ